MKYTIIGGGIAGLTTALAFQKLGVPYALFERAESIKEVGAGIWLSPNALQVFEWIDPKLLFTIQQSGNELDRIMVANHHIKPLSDSNQSFVKNKFGYSTMAIHRGKLQQILYDFVDEKNVHLNKSFEQFSYSKKDAINIEFTDGSSFLANALIGADGINSKVRKQLFPKSKIRYSGQTCWRGISNFNLDSELESTGFTLWGKKLQFGVSKISEGKVYWFAVKLSKPNEQDNKEGLKNLLTKMFSSFHPLILNLIQNTPVNNIIRSDLSDLELLDKWSKDNICLMGDAAHSMTPDLGQGGAQAIEDAFYLSNFISRSTTAEIAYHKFYDYRKEKVQKLVKQSRLTSRIAITNSAMEVVRNFLLKRIPETYTQKQMIELYQLNKIITGKV